MSLDEKDIDYLDHRYRKLEDCNDIVDGLEEKHSIYNADLAVIKFQNKMLLGIMSAVGIAVLSLVINQFWG